MHVKKYIYPILIHYVEKIFMQKNICRVKLLKFDLIENQFRNVELNSIIFPLLLTSLQSQLKVDLR